MNRFQKMTIEELTAWWVFRQLDGCPSLGGPADLLAWIEHARDFRAVIEEELLADYGDHEKVFGSVSGEPSHE